MRLISAVSFRILDVRTNQISTLPGSKGFFSPRWSPDGRHLVALPFQSRSLVLFDFATQKWDEIAKITVGFPHWSKNGDYVYFLHEEDQPSVMRIRIRDRKIERVADLKKLPANRLLHAMARHGSRRFTTSASRHRNTGNLCSRLASPVTHARRSHLPPKVITVAIRRHPLSNPEEVPGLVMR